MPTLAEQPPTLEPFAGPWWIYQRRRGQRYSTDDVLTAWTAREATAQLSRPAMRVLDLCAGTGSIGLLVLQQLSSTARLVSVELQAASAALLRKTVRHNRLDERVTVLERDLRQLTQAPGLCGGPFDLITANPPYLPLGSGRLSPHVGRAQARVELNGDVFDLCRVAADLLAPAGVFCFCFAAADCRPPQAIDAAGMSLYQQRQVRFRVGAAPRLTIYCCGWQATRTPLQVAPLTVRDGHGGWSTRYWGIRRVMGLEGGEAWTKARVG